MTLVWQCKYAHAGTTVNFAWEETYNAFWAQPSCALEYGAIIKTSSVSPKLKYQNYFQYNTSVASSEITTIDIEKNNKLSLSYDLHHNSYFFKEKTGNGEKVISITCDNSVPNFKRTTISAVAGIGVGMNGKGSQIRGAEPNLPYDWKMIVPTYYLIYGNFREGQILSLEEMNRGLLLTYEDTLTCSVLLTTQNKLIIS